MLLFFSGDCARPFLRFARKTRPGFDQQCVGSRRRTSRHGANRRACKCWDRASQSVLLRAPPTGMTTVAREGAIVDLDDGFPASRIATLSPLVPAGRIAGTQTVACRRSRSRARKAGQHASGGPVFRRRWFDQPTRGFSARGTLAARVLFAGEARGAPDRRSQSPQSAGGIRAL